MWRPMDPILKTTAMTHHACPMLRWLIISVTAVMSSYNMWKKYWTTNTPTGAFMASLSRSKGINMSAIKGFRLLGVCLEEFLPIH